MSILTEKLPETIEIDGVPYSINTDYRVWIQFSRIAFKNEQKSAVSFAKIIVLIFGENEKCPPLNAKTMKALVNFFAPEKNAKQSTSEPSSRKKQFDYDFDAGLIYAAFRQQYGIDLTKVDMHWWLFKALFESLSDETHFGKVLQYRGMDLSSIKNKDMKKHYERMKRVYALPDERTEDEKERDFAEGLASVF